MSQLQTQTKALTAQTILLRLEQKVSLNNAKLILDSAKISSGMTISMDNALELTNDQAKCLCLKMINQGGPAFHVGQAIYKEYLM